MRDLRVHQILEGTNEIMRDRRAQADRGRAVSASAAVADDAVSGDVIVRREGAAGVIRLNRPKAINALTVEMARDTSWPVSTAFEADPGISLVLLEGAGERGLCAGGDIRGLYESAKAGGDLGPVFWREEYVLNARIQELPKPYVAYMDGLVMGGGVGLSAHGAHRIVTEKTKWRCRKSALARCWRNLAACAHARRDRDLFRSDRTDHERCGRNLRRCCGCPDQVRRLARTPRCACERTFAGEGQGCASDLDRFAETGIQAPVAAYREQIDRAFAQDTVEAIMEALKQDGSEFALTTLKALSEKSPTALKVTLELLHRARGSKSLKECLVREYNSALAVFTSAEFIEEVRAAIIDKDRNPKWSPERIEDGSRYCWTYCAERKIQAGLSD